MTKLITNQPKVYEGNRGNFYNECFPIIKKLFDENDLQLADKIQIQSSHKFDLRSQSVQGTCFPTRFSSDNETRHCSRGFCP